MQRRKGKAKKGRKEKQKQERNEDGFLSGFSCCSLRPLCPSAPLRLTVAVDDL